VAETSFQETSLQETTVYITAVYLLMEKLAPEQIIVSPVHVVCGQVKCANGILPVPLPAIARDKGISLSDVLSAPKSKE